MSAYNGDNSATGEPEPSYFEESRPFSQSEQDWYWAPLLNAIGAEAAQQFDWRAETGTIQTYEHRETFRYVHIDSITGQFYDQGRNVTTREAALAHAMPPPPVPEPPSAPPPEQEAQLASFTRKDGPEPVPHFWRGWAVGFQRLPTGKLSNRLSGVLSRARHKAQPGEEDDIDLSAGLSAKGNGMPAQPGVRETGDDPDQSLATFTRRTTEFKH